MNEIRFKRQLIELQSRQLQIAVLEVIEVEHHRCTIHFPGRIALAVDIVVGALELECRQFTHHQLKHDLSHLAILAVRPVVIDEAVQRAVAQVFLENAQSAFVNGIDSRHRQMACCHRQSQIVESSVFLGRGANDTNHGFTAFFRDAVVAAVAPCPREFVQLNGSFPERVLVEFYQSLRFHIDITLERTAITLRTETSRSNPTPTTKAISIDGVSILGKKVSNRPRYC